MFFSALKAALAAFALSAMPPGAHAAGECNAFASTARAAGDVLRAAAAANPEAGEPIDLKTLTKAARNASTKCRIASPTSSAGNQVGGSKCGNISKGKCVEGVRDILRELGINMPNSKTAPEQKAWLEKNFEKLNGLGVSGDVCAKAPPGVVCLYHSGVTADGHIEVKSGDNQYCSDFCSAGSAYNNKKLQMTVIGVYRIKKN